MKLSRLQDGGCSPPGTHPHTGSIFSGVQSLGTPSPEQPPTCPAHPGSQDGDAPRWCMYLGHRPPCGGEGRGPSPMQSHPQAPKCQQQGSLPSSSQPQHLLKNDSCAILSHPANFSKHLPIKLYKYIHLVNIPLTRSAYSIHNLLQSSTKSITEAIMQL